MKTKVLIVDDHRQFREALKTLVNSESDMEVVGEAENGEQAVALARKLFPDVILMDVKMPVMDGAQATSQILAELPGIRIWALSIYSDDRFASNMIRAGALGYILKGCEAEDLFTAIRRAQAPASHRPSEYLH